MSAQRSSSSSVIRLVGWVAIVLAVLIAAILVYPGTATGSAVSPTARWSHVAVALAFGAVTLAICRTVATLADVRRQADAEARRRAESELRTQAILDTAADSIATMDDQGLIESFNAAAERMFGYSADEVIGRHIGVLMPLSDDDPQDERTRHRIQTEEAKRIGGPQEREARRKDGAVILVEATVSELQLSGRRLFAGIFRDVSERKRVERSLRESERFLQAVIDGASDPLLVIDREYNVVLANRAARDLAGEHCSASGAGLCYRMSHHRDEPCEGAEHPCPLHTAIATRGPAMVTHTHYDAKDEEAIVEVIASPILDEAGEVPLVIEMCRDITARVRAEERAWRRQAELAHVARLGTMGEMASGLAHELNQPLAAIVNHVQACLERIRGGAADSDELLVDMERVAAQAGRAGEMIEHIRGFVRKREPQRALCDLNAIVRDAVALVNSELRQSQVRPRLELAEGLPSVDVQAIQIEQVMVNLLRNAVEAMGEVAPECRRLSIRTARPEANVVELSVEDTGHGLTDQMIDRAFDPFFTTKSHGMGMGLNISQTIVEAHGGRLWFKRNPERGATFAFTLPVSEGGHRDGS